jgi:putative transport protein
VDETTPVYSGALTNAPALAAAQEVLRDNQRTLPAAALQQLIDQAVIAFGMAYPFGVFGVMLSFQLYRSLFRIKPAAAEAGDRIEVRDFVVQNPRVTGHA